ncbi:MAG: translocation/assembly module TamB domain-containing protein [bacterium]
MPTKRKRTKRRVRRKIWRVISLTVFLSLAVIVSIIILSYQSGYIHERLRQLAEERLAEYCGREVKIDELTGSLISDVTLRGLVIAHDGQIEGGVCLDVESVTVKYNIIDFLRKKIRLREVIVESPIVFLGKDSQGNYSLKEVFRPTKPIKRGPSKFVMTIDEIYVKDAYYSMNVDFPIIEYEHCNIHARYNVRKGISTIEVIDSSCYIPSYDLNVLSFGGKITAGGGTVLMEGLYAETNLINMHASGLVEYSPKLHWTISTEGSKLASSEIDRIFFSNKGIISGEMDLNATLEGGHEWFKSVGSVALRNGNLVKYPYRSMSMDYSYSEKHLFAQNIDIVMDGGRFKGEAELFNKGKNSLYNLHFKCSSFDMAYFQNLTGIHTNLEASVVMAGSGFTKDKLNLDILFEINGGKLGGISIDTASGKIGLRDMGCEIEGLTVKVGDSDALFTGRMGFDGSIDMVVNVINFPLQNITSIVGYPIYSGKCDVICHLSGKLRSPDTKAEVRLADMDAQNLNIKDGLLSIDINDINGSPQGSFNFISEGLRFYKVSLNKLSLGGFVSSGELLIDKAVASMVGGFVIDGSLKYISKNKKEKELIITDFNVSSNDFNILKTDELRAEFSEGNIYIHKSDFNFLGGIFSIMDSQIGENSISFEVIGGGMNIDALDQLYGRRDIFCGFVNKMNMRVGGTTLTPELEFNLTLNGGPVKYMEDSSVNVSLHFLNNNIHINRFDIDGSVGRFSATGDVPINLSSLIEGKNSFYSPLSLDISFTDFELKFINNFTNWVFVDKGRVTSKLRLKGMPNSPYFDGDVFVEDGYVVIGKYGVQIRNINGVMLIDGMSILIDSDNPIKGEIDKGTVRASGSITFPITPGMPSFNMNIILSNCVLRGVPKTTGIITADVLLKGTPYKDFALVGKVKVSEGLITYNFTEKGETSVASRDSMDIEIYVVGENNIWLRNSTADIELSTDMVIRRKDGEFNITGELSAIRGYYYFLKKDFMIERGTVIFQGTSEINPDIDILGSLMIRDQETKRESPVYIQIKGTLKEPEISLYSPDFPNLSQQDIITIVALDMTWDEYRETSAGELAGSQSREYIQRYVEDELSRSLRRGTGLDTLRIRTNLISGEGPESVKITVGKYITRRFYISMTSDLYTTQGQTFGAEYYLGRRFSVMSQTFSEEGAYKYSFNIKYRIMF